MKILTQGSMARRENLTPRTFGTGRQRGFSTIEILIAFGVGIIFLSAAMMVSLGMQPGNFAPQVAQHSFDTGQATALDSFFDNRGLASTTRQFGFFLAQIANNWNFTPPTVASTASDLYSYTPDVLDISPCMKQVIATTTWESLNGRDRHITFGTTLSNMDIAHALGPSGCDPFPSNEWDSPKKYATGVTISAVNANDIIIVHEAGRRIAVLGTTASAPAKDDIYLYDLTDPEHPSTVLGSLNTGKGINAIAYHDGYIFALQNDATNQLQVIQIFNRTLPDTSPAYFTPSLITQTSLNNVGGAYPEGRSIAYYDGHIYAGTWNNNIPANSPEFLIYRVTTPESPVFLGSYNLGHSVNKIMIKDTNAYLATTNNTGELTIMNVSSKSAPTVLSTYNLPGSIVDAEEVSVLGNRAYVGLNRSPGNGVEFFITDISNPNAPSLLGSMNLGLKNNTKVTALEVRGRYAFIGTDVSNEEFRVLDIARPGTPMTLPCSPYNYSAKVSDLQYADGFIFLSNQANDAIRVIYDTEGTTCN